MIEFTGDNKLLKFCDALMEMDYGFHIKNCVNPTVHNALMKITNRTQTNTMTFISDDIHSICYVLAFPVQIYTFYSNKHLLMCKIIG